MAWTITTATADERREALELVLRQVADSDAESAAQTEELLDSCRQGEISLAGLFIGRRDSEMAGAGLVILQSDGTAHVWPPAVTKAVLLDKSRAEETLKQLGLHGVNWLKKSNARLAQCVTPIHDRAIHQLLETLGFEPLTELLGLQQPLIDIPHAPLPDDCEVSTSIDASAERFEEVMRQTYASSQDCQGLQGRRTAAECLAAHRLAGSFDPALWQLFHVLGEDMGIMLCADHRDQRMWELLYLGVTPRFRNQGFGTAMVSDLLWNARISGAEGVLVAVDASNVAAKSLYELCGFQERFRKQIHIWTHDSFAGLDSTGCAQPRSLDGTFQVGSKSSDSLS